MKSIPFTRPFLPPKAAYDAFLEGIWQRSWLTNDGPLLQELEEKLKQHLGVRHLVATANGTLALQFALRALAQKGEIITTPFSYIATATSVLWEGFQPVFADVSPDDFNISPESVVPRINSNTKAILATHVFGNACDINALQTLATYAGIPLIFDGAHAFGSSYKGQSVFAYGDATMGSLHATKLYHAVEGGLVATQSEALETKLKFMRNFGHNGPGKFAMPGINGKMSELHAAMGLTNFEWIETLLQDRKEIWQRYAANLSGASLQMLKLRDEAGFNYAYFPVVFETEEMLLKTLTEMEAKDIQPRRYFYPALSEIPFLNPQKEKLPVAEAIARRVLCLPMYHGMRTQEIDYVCSFLI